MATVNAAVMTAPGRIELRPFPRPAIGDDEIGITGSEGSMKGIVEP